MTATGHNVDDEPLPEEIAGDLRKAVRLEWVTIVALVFIVGLVYAVMGNSQAMKTAWIEDMLSFIPPIAFPIGVRITRRPATAELGQTDKHVMAVRMGENAFLLDLDEYLQSTEGQP